MRYRVFLILSLISALLVIATAAVAVRSRTQWDQFEYGNRSGAWDAIFSRGGIILMRTALLNANVIPENPGGHTMHRSGAGPAYPFARNGGLLSKLGFAASRQTMPIPSAGISGQVTTVVIPMWLPALLCLILPVMAVRSILKNRRRPAINHCQVCGYDLRATPQRCPECGRVPVKEFRVTRYNH